MNFNGSLAGHRMKAIVALPLVALLLVVHYGFGIGNFGLAQPSDATAAVRSMASGDTVRYGNPGSASCSLRAGGTSIFGFVVQTTNWGSLYYGCNTATAAGQTIQWCVTYVAGNTQTPFVEPDTTCSP